MSRRALGVLSPNSERPATLPSKHSASQAVVSKETVTEVAVREYQQDRNFTAVSFKFHILNKQMHFGTRANH